MYQDLDLAFHFQKPASLGLPALPDFQPDFWCRDVNNQAAHNIALSYTFG